MTDSRTWRDAAVERGGARTRSPAWSSGPRRDGRIASATSNGTEKRHPAPPRRARRASERRCVHLAFFAFHPMHTNSPCSGPETTWWAASGPARPGPAAPS
ncbi:Voltage-dependent calcium channel type A subunit alpha-1 [Frankliniella fusca]|uniref:Voltage-dependent calcium channel type A subunit alpha-1 n=1 Tax=Frankliniella fusca TaxID=407009 RepID=A0AAE1H9V6_9NEOP|nr:Voltage-dependent calcium channel type A subunit alpha-1 [Frankliniella fusca]